MKSLYIKYAKRVMDILLTIAVLLVLLPVITLVTTISIIFFNKKPFFTQMRAGVNGTPFKLYKFRSMRDGEDHDPGRVTRYGYLLRKFSLDELPQLLNVLAGDMSLVGPRPLLIEYNKLYNNQQKKRLLLKPGITGWAQVNGRNALSWEERFRLDVWYVEHCTFLLDLKILFLTAVKAIMRINTKSEDFQPVKPFTGTNHDK